MQRLEKACCSLQKMARLLSAIITWNAEETSWCNKEFILWKSSAFNNMGLVAIQQILFPIISMKMCLIISERKTDLLIPVTSIYLITQFGTSWKRYSTRNYRDMKTAMSYVWDRLTKKSSIIQSTNGGCH